MNWVEYKIVRQSDGHVYRDWAMIPAGGMTEAISKAVVRWGPRIEFKMRGERPLYPPSTIDFFKDTS